MPLSAAHLSRMEYDPSTPVQGSFPGRSSSRPGSSGGMDSRTNLSRRSRRSSKSSPKHTSNCRTSWPPPGYSSRTIITADEALRLVGRGSLEFHGKAINIPLTNNIKHDAYRFYGSVLIEGRAVKDTVSNPDESLKDISLSFMGPKEGQDPWGSLEYPNMLYAFGKSPGTTTLNWFVGMRGHVRSPLDFGDRPTRKRKIKLISILERLRDLEDGLGEDEQEQYNFLYTRLIEDPDHATQPHYDRAQQIVDLLHVLMNKEWIDFSLPKNQVVARYWDSPDPKVKARFFHQLLLAIELHLRIQHKEHFLDNKRALLRNLPPKVSWDLALAQRWLENVGIEQETINRHDSEFQFKLGSKKHQKSALKHFARLLKWPNMQQVEKTLEEKDKRSGPIEERTSDTMCWFTGVVLPGPTLPFILMNSLIDCDDSTGPELEFLTHVNPSCGFQYRANTYWSYKCILGKVLGASRGVKQVSGWVGPCQFSPDLARSQCVIILTDEPPQHGDLYKNEVEAMDLVSHVLGTDDLDGYYIRDFKMPLLPNALETDEAIRIQKVAFTELDAKPERGNRKGAKPYEAAVVFAATGNNMPVRLRYDVDFIYIPPCDNGPHPLFHTYQVRFARVEDDLRDMAGLNGEFTIVSDPDFAADAASHYYSNDWFDDDADSDDDDSHNSGRFHSRRRSMRGYLAPNSELDDEPSLVVDASGVSDNEVFARAWCAHWGEHAVVANLKETCIACAVRASKACQVRVVIVTEGGREEERDRGVCDLLSTVG